MPTIADRLNLFMVLSSIIGHLIFVSHRSPAYSSHRGILVASLFTPPPARDAVPKRRNGRWPHARELRHNLLMNFLAFGMPLLA
jgi:hypothetical protein